MLRVEGLAVLYDIEAVGLLLLRFFIEGFEVLNSVLRAHVLHVCHQVDDRAADVRGEAEVHADVGGDDDGALIASVTPRTRCAVDPVPGLVLFGREGQQFVCHSLNLDASLDFLALITKAHDTSL